MRIRSLIEKFGYYEETLRQLAEYPLAEEPKVEKLGRGAVQRAYQEMKQEHYYGTIIQYLANVGGRFYLELRIKDGSIFDWPRLVAYLENEPMEASILARSALNMRIVDAVELYKRVNNDPQLSNQMHQSLMNLGQVGTILKHGLVDDAELGCVTLIRRIKEYQIVKHDSDASNTTTQPQTTNQPTKRKKKATLPAREK